MNKGKTKNPGLVNVFFLGMVSFFTDISTEMVYPLIPLYLTAVFGATPAMVGFIEGVAESLASLLKVYSGYVSDRFQHKKAIAFAGYFAGIVYKLALIAATSWGGVLFARVIDRFGKGVRTAPRDVLVSESADKDKMGNAFGLHKALDTAGAALGILFTFLLLGSGSGNYDYKMLFGISIVPAVLGLCMFFFIKEKRGKRTQKKWLPFFKSFGSLDGQLKLYLLVVLLFTLGNSSDAFLLLKAKDVGFSSQSVILLYFIFHVAAAALSLPLGGLSDRIGRKKLLVSGYFVFAAVYFGFAAAFSKPFMYLMFILYGVHTAMIAGVERAYVAEIAPPELKGTMLGLQSTVAGIALLPASIVTGALWSTFGSVVPFAYGATLSAAAAVVLLLFMKQAK